MTLDVDFGRSELYAKAIECYGKDNQIRMAIEEMSELTKELCKFFRGETDLFDLSSEIADVFITLEQLILIFDCEIEVESYIERKINRLSERLAVFYGG
jgi:NTP pyrophosphatase (non-canonical NTP hydrolase)